MAFKINASDVGANSVWVKKSGDGTLCINCEDLIFGNRFILSYKVLGEILESKIQLCESCYELNKDSTRR
jgi:hypothetical protein